jgi:hypothetical protein
MEPFGIALAGVIVGAVVSEGLHFWQGHWNDRRRLRGSLRLVRTELAFTAAILDRNDVSADEIRERIERKTISNVQWLNSEPVIAALMDRETWSALSGCYVGIQLMINGFDRSSDEELVDLASGIVEDIKAVESLPWLNG